MSRLKYVVVYLLIVVGVIYTHIMLSDLIPYMVEYVKEQDNSFTALFILSAFIGWSVIIILMPIIILIILLIIFERKNK
jgi:hypothetical protein